MRNMRKFIVWEHSLIKARVQKSERAYRKVGGFRGVMDVNALITLKGARPNSLFCYALWEADQRRR